MNIESLENPKVKLWTKLQQKKYRNETDLFLVEGINLVTEAYKTGNLVELILRANEEFSLDVDTYFVTPEIIKKITTLDTPNSVLGVCRKLKEQKFGNKILILEDIQDPGNLGTIIRSACAFNIDTIILSENTVDLYNPKVVRATQGLLFKVNIIIKNLDDVLKTLKTEEYQIYGTNVNKGINIRDIKKIDKLCIIFGNEGKGITSQAEEFCNGNIYIPMNGKCESLNVGVAAGIILYELDNK